MMIKRIIFSSVLFLAVLVGAAQNVPYLNEDFEDMEFPPIGWTIYDIEGSYSTIGRYEFDMYGSTNNSYCAMMYMVSLQGTLDTVDRYIITPKLSPVIGDSLRFLMFSSPESFTNTFTVEVSTSDVSTDNFSVIRTIEVSDFPTENWYSFAIDMSPYAGQNIYVAFHDVQFQGSVIGLDNVSGVRLFVPDCDTIVVTDNDFYIEDFSVLPGCWDLTSGPNSWGYNSAGGFLSHNSVFDTFTCDAISPLLDISAVTTPYLRFSQRRPSFNSSYFGAESLTIYCRNASNADTVWLPLVTYTESVADWQYDSVALPPNISLIQLKFTGKSMQNGNGIYIDDVMVYNNTGDHVITDPEIVTEPVTGLTNHTATMRASLTNQYYVPIMATGFEWKSALDSNYTIVFAGTPSLGTTSYSLTFPLEGLDESTTYNYRAFITYNNITVFSDERSFTTLSCGAPTGLHATDVGLDYIILEWDDVPDVSVWQVRYGANGDWYSSMDVETNMATFHYSFEIYYESAYHFGHSPLYYDFSVRADCGDSTWSSWSDRITVATPYVGIEERLQKAVTLYPNPATSYVDVRVDGDVNVTGMEVYDVFGKIVRRADVCNTSLQGRIDVSNLPNGIYFVRVKTDCGNVSKKFVKHNP